MSTWLNQLKIVRHRVQPDATFAAHSRQLIMATTKTPLYRTILGRQLRQTFVLSVAMSMATVLIFVLSSVSHLQLDGFSPALLASLNQSDINQEQQGLDFNLSLAQARYYTESTQQVTMALSTIFSDSLSDPDSIKRQAAALDGVIKELTL